MSSHSQFKKFNILQELEQAIKKKTQEKYNPHRSKSRNRYHPQISRPSENAIKAAQVKSPVAEKHTTHNRKATTGGKVNKIPEFK